jgi:hypothetical protein
MIVLSLAVVLLLGAEIAVRQWKAPRACVQIINQGEGPMDDLLASYSGTEVPVGRLVVGQSTHIWLTAGPKGSLRLDFRQKGNALKGFQVPDFEPSQMIQDGFKLVLVVKSNEIQRFVEDADAQAGTETLGDRIKQWIMSP